MDYTHMKHQCIGGPRQHFLPLVAQRRQDYSNQFSNNHFLHLNKILPVQLVKILQCVGEEQQLEDHLVSLTSIIHSYLMA